MDWKDILTLVGGLCLFLFGMNVMGEGLEKSAGNQLKSILSKFTSNPIKGFILGAGVTAVIQSSSATTVMLVGFVNSGILSLAGAIPIIMGANVGTTITAWLLSLTGVEGSGWLEIFKPSTFTPILALLGVVLYVFMKNPKRKDIGLILLGFATLIYGMDIMSGSVAGLKDVPEFAELFVKFQNPLLGVLVGTLVTAIIQSSSASVGILQALSSTGKVSFGAAIPIIMGQNIGTCVTALISSVGANKNAKRVAVVHLSFNIIGTAIMLSLFYGANAIFDFTFINDNIDEKWIAIIHSLFNVGCTAILLPFCKALQKLAFLIVPEKSANDEKYTLFDNRLLSTPSIAIERARTVAIDMAHLSSTSLHRSFALIENGYDKKTIDKIFKEEGEVDTYEDEIGSYLVKITSQDLTQNDSHEVTKLLHMIGDFERLSDHAINVAESIQELHDKDLSFSDKAKEELGVMVKAIDEILDISMKAFEENNIDLAMKVEPLEQVIDSLQTVIKTNHIGRLKNSECTIELGFILSDLLTNLERISDHCSNIANCVIEISHNSLGMHGYKKSLRAGDDLYDSYFAEYSDKYALNLEF
ncbi:MAG: Na/Pi cotransporter family protein [Clostridia bacterium]|nr:Na/Pi cotransporter family protein [Clostridia bacterium]